MQAKIATLPANLAGYCLIAATVADAPSLLIRRDAARRE